MELTLTKLKSTIEALSPGDRRSLFQWIARDEAEGATADINRASEPKVTYDFESAQPLVSAKDYLQRERDGEIRHEYVEGRVYAISGASDDHNRIAGNLFSVIHSALRGKPCEAFIGDMKVRVALKHADAYYYPDVVVACHPSERDEYYREHPTVVVEVLSPSTRLIDEREKAIAYRLIPSLEVYVMVEQRRMQVTAMRRTKGRWRQEEIAGRGAALALDCIGVEIPLTTIYERTRALLTPPGT